jgi:hypothetical protein
MTKAKVTSPATPEVGFSAEEYMDKFDPATKIRNGLAKLGNRCIFEFDLAKLCGMTPQLFTAHKKAFEADYLVREPQSNSEKPVWAGSKQLAAKLRGGVK